MRTRLVEDRTVMSRKVYLQYSLAIGVAIVTW